MVERGRRKKRREGKEEKEIRREEERKEERRGREREGDRQTDRGGESDQPIQLPVVAALVNRVRYGQRMVLLVLLPGLWR